MYSWCEMKRLLSLALSLATLGCTTSPLTPVTDASAPLPLPLSHETKQVVLKGPLAPYGPTIIVPRGWTHRFETGEDSQSHYLEGDGAKATLEYWVDEPRPACRDAGCWKVPVTVGGHNTAFVLHSGTRFEIFLPESESVPSRPRRGVWMQARCQTVDACVLTQRVAQSVRF